MDERQVVLLDVLVVAPVTDPVLSEIHVTVVLGSDVAATQLAVNVIPPSLNHIVHTS
jgi:hypothetical protein